MNKRIVAAADGAGLSDLDWNTFLDTSPDLSHTFPRKQRCASLNLSPNTGITLMALGFLKQMKKLDIPGVIIGVSDYQREALMLCLELVFSTALRTRVRHSTLPPKIHAGDLLGFADTVMEYRGVSEHEVFGKMLEYCPGNKMRLDKFPKLHRVKDGSEINVLKKRRPPLHKQIDAYQEIPKKLRHIFDVCSYIPEAVGIGVPATPLPNVTPTTLGSIKIGVKNEEYDLRELLPVAHYTGDGDAHLDYAYKIDASPSIVSSKRDRNGNSDLFDFVDYLERGGKLSCVVIELSNSQGLNDYIGELKDLWALHRTPVLIFCDASVANEVEHADDLKYERFVWTRQLLSLHKALYSHFPLSKTQRALTQQNCLLLPIEPKQELLNSAAGLENLWAAQRRMTLDEQESLSQLTRLHYQTLRQTTPLPNDRFQRISSQLKCIQRTLCDGDGGYSLSNDETSVVRFICDNILISSAPDRRPNKTAAFSERLESLDENEHLCLIVPNEESKSTEAQFWISEATRLKLDPSRLRVTTPNRFLKDGPTSDHETVVISGWFNRSRMEQLLNSGYSELYYLLLYTGRSLEVDWYKLAPNAWERSNDIAFERNRNTLDRMGIPLPASLIPDSDSSTKLPSSPESQSDPVEDRERLGRLTGETQKPVPSTDECFARQIVFSNGERCFLECSHAGGSRLSVVPDISSLPCGCLKKTADALEPGDMVLRIRNYVDGFEEFDLHSGQYATAFREARAWHAPIEAALRYMSRSRIVDRISDAGCLRNFETIARWIDDPDLIMPKSKKDIECIGKALCMPFSDEDIHRMSQAASFCRGERIVRGRGLISDWTDRFSLHYLSLRSPEDALRECNKEAQGRCTFHLLQVDAISDQIIIPKRKLGWSSTETRRNDAR